MFLTDDPTAECRRRCFNANQDIDAKRRAKMPPGNRTCQRSQNEIKTLYSSVLSLLVLIVSQTVSTRWRHCWRKNYSSTREEKGGKAVEASGTKRGARWRVEVGDERALEHKCEENEKVEVAPGASAAVKRNSDPCRPRGELQAATHHLYFGAD